MKFDGHTIGLQQLWKSSRVGLGFSYYYHLEMVAAAYIYKYTLLWQARKELENLTYVDDVHIIRY